MIIQQAHTHLHTHIHISSIGLEQQWYISRLIIVWPPEVVLKSLQALELHGGGPRRLIRANHLALAEEPHSIDTYLSDLTSCYETQERSREMIVNPTSVCLSQPSFSDYQILQNNIGTILRQRGL